MTKQTSKRLNVWVYGNGLCFVLLCTLFLVWCNHIIDAVQLPPPRRFSIDVWVHQCGEGWMDGGAQVCYVTIQWGSECMVTDRCKGGGCVKNVILSVTLRLKNSLRVRADQSVVRDLKYWGVFCVLFHMKPIFNETLLKLCLLTRICMKIMEKLWAEIKNASACWRYIPDAKMG